ncbi:type II secretion system F family protein [Candidatus Woesearchaeota archaeon]|nr:type II secretion system F family protein [Candidatus Woesearchaeota archaeon]
MIRFIKALNKEAFSIVTRLFPEVIKKHFEELYKYSRIKVNKETFLGFFLILSIIISLAVAAGLKLIFEANQYLVFFISFVVLQVTVYFTFSLKADANGKFVENILPDALHLMSSNLRAGLTVDKALLLSARPEFGIFSDEIKNIGKKLSLGEDINKSLLGISENIKSDVLNKTILLIVSGLRSGGELVELLDQISRNLRQKIFLDEKIKSNILMYVIFIFAAISFGAPILFGFSSFLVNVLEKNLALVEIPKGTAFPISFGGITVSSSFIVNFSIISLITTSILGSLVLGLISKGNEKAGFRYMPFLIAMTMIVFFLSRFFVKTMLSGLFGLD